MDFLTTNENHIINCLGLQLSVLPNFPFYVIDWCVVGGGREVKERV